MLLDGKGVHVAVPLRRTASWHTVKPFSRRVTLVTAHAQPDSFAAKISNVKRKGRIVID